MGRLGPGNGRKRFSLRDGTSAVINMKNRGNWKHRFGSKSRSSGNWSRADSTGRSIYTSEKLSGGRKRSSSFHFFWASASWDLKAVPTAQKKWPYQYYIIRCAKLQNLHSIDQIISVYLHFMFLVRRI
jgi:hypothetical protein